MANAAAYARDGRWKWTSSAFGAADHNLCPVDLTPESAREREISQLIGKGDFGGTKTSAAVE